MSHVVNIETEILDLEALKDAVKELGFTWNEGKTTYEWWGHHVGDYPLPVGFKKTDIGKCDHEIEVPGCNWSVGVVKSKDPARNGYTFLFDFFGPKGDKLLRNIGGKKAHKLVQMYSVHKTERELKKRKYKYTRKKQANGDILIQALV